jgi:hypothetical protein
VEQSGTGKRIVISWQRRHNHEVVSRTFDLQDRDLPDLLDCALRRCRLLLLFVLTLNN